MIRKLFATLLIGTLFFTLFACDSPNTVLVLNPYEDVDWEVTDQALTNLHTHTTYSDGSGMPHEVVDHYHEYGYDILALTDHDEVAYPWTFSDIDPTWEDRDPEALGMLDIEGNELTITRNSWFPDVVSLFTDYKYDLPDSLSGDPEAFHNSLDEMAEIEDSVMFIAHPGREWKPYRDYEEGDMFSNAWWVELFETYSTDQLLGLEVYNRYDQHPDDRGLWDSILVETMPERPVWGLGNDDYHGDGESGNIHRSFTHQLISGDFTEDALRQSLRQGHFFASNVNDSAIDAPTIQSITVDEKARTITIEGDDYDAIQWFHGADEFFIPIQVGEGETFEYGSFEGNYVRAKLIRDEDGPNEAKTLTQPFGFSQED